MDYHSGFNVSSILLSIEPLSTSFTVVLVITLSILLLLSFLIAGSEIAFFALEPKDISVLKTRKHPAYRRIVNLLEQPATLMATMFMANCLLNLGVILVANQLIDSWLPATLSENFWPPFLIKLFSISITLLLFVEILPKVWATQHKIRFASAASLTVEIFNSMFYGLSKKWVKAQDNLELRWASKKSSELSNHIDDEIDLLPEHEASSEEKQILKGIRKFSDTEVKQIMRTRMDVSGINYNCNFEELMQKVNELNYSRLPVYINSLDEIQGMLHTKDLLPHLNAAPDFDWHPLMRNAFFVHEQKLIEDLLEDFRNKRIHFAIVVDEFGGTSGIATLEDIMEEIIGDIKDEFDDEESVNKKLDDYNFIFEGKLMINDACKAMGLPVNTFDSVRGESDSVAGLLLEIAGEFPQLNEELISGDFVFIPLAINKNRIDTVKITIRPSQMD